MITAEGEPVITALAQTAANESDPLIGFIAVGGIIAVVALIRFGVAGLVSLGVGLGGILFLGKARAEVPLTDKQTLGLCILGVACGYLFAEATFTPRGGK